MRFPDRFDAVRASGPNQFTEALAGRLARLANAGHLRIEDPVREANEFIALVCEELPGMSALGTRPLDPADVAKVVTAGVDTFLRAFGTQPARPRRDQRLSRPCRPRLGSLRRAARRREAETGQRRRTCGAGTRRTAVFRTWSITSREGLSVRLVSSRASVLRRNGEPIT